MYFPTTSFKRKSSTVRKAFCCVQNCIMSYLSSFLFAFPGHLLLPDDPDYTCCGGHVLTLDSLFSVPQSLSPSLSICLYTQIFEWHVSHHLARTCIAYGRCIMALGLSNAALLQHVGQVTRGRETNRLCKSIKMTKQLLLHLLTPCKKNRNIEGILRDY